MHARFLLLPLVSLPLVPEVVLLLLVEFLLVPLVLLIVEIVGPPLKLVGTIILPSIPSVPVFLLEAPSLTIVVL